MRIITIRTMIAKITKLGLPLAALVAILMTPIGTDVSYNFINGYVLHPIMVDKLGWMFAFTFIVITLIGNIYALHNNDKKEGIGSFIYAFGTIGVALCGDLVSFIFCWELMSVAALIVIWDKKRPASVGAGFRYLMVHMFGGNMMLAGILYKIANGSSILLYNMNSEKDIGYWLIFTAICINAAVVPLHAWIVDAYPESSITGVVFLNSFTTKIAVFAMIRFLAGEKLLVWAGVFMALYGACFAIIENNYRRLLSYHIVSQVGFMVAAAGIGTHMAINGAAVHTVNNILYKSLLFMCVGVILKTSGIKRINELGGLYKKFPFMCVCFFIAALSIAGFPLFAGFISKPMIGEAAIEAGYPIVQMLLNIAGIGTVLSIPCKMGYFLFFAPEKTEIKETRVPLNMNIAIGIGAFLCILVGVFPNLLYELMPFENEYHVFSHHVIIEYLELLPAAVIPFVMYIKHMEPHTAITLDTDWIYRKILPVIIGKISALVDNTRLCFGKVGALIYKKAVNYLSCKETIFDVDKKRGAIGKVIIEILTFLIVFGIIVMI